MKSKIYSVLALLLLCALFSATGCTAATAPDRIMEDFLRRYSPLPAGHLYESEASSYEAEYLSEDLIAALYGREDGSSEFEEAVEQAVLYLGESRTDPFELAIFRCRGSGYTEAVLEMCRRRIALFSRVCDAPPCLLYRGDTVLLLLGADEEGEAILRALL